MSVHLTKSLEETQNLAAEWIASLGSPAARLGATVVGLSGELGSGKTSFTQGVAKALGVEEHVTSPTFILERIYKLQAPKFKAQPSTKSQVPNFSHLVHIDCYRMDGPHELKQIGFDELANDPSNLILLEWPQRVAEGLPKDMATLSFKFIDENTRKINLL